MIEAIAKIGKSVREEAAKSEIEQLIENKYLEPGQGKAKEQKVLKIIIEHNDEGFKFLKVEEEDLKKDSCTKMLYRSYKGNDINPSPSAQITEKDTLSLKIFGFFKASLSKSDLREDYKDYLEGIYQALKNSESEIRKELSNYDVKKITYFLTLVIKEGGEFKYIEQIPVFVDLFKSRILSKESRYRGYGKCSICGKEGEVYGGVFPYSFFNTDKDGFLVNFSKYESYKNFPICVDCIRDLEEGKRYIERKLTRNFVSGLKYQLIPQPILEEESIKTVLDTVEYQDKTISTKDLKSLTDDEKDILYQLKELKDTVSFNFLFLQKQNKAEKIIAYIQDVLPSRISAIYEAKEKVDSRFKDVKFSQFRFSTIREFFLKSDRNKSESDLDKYFLDVVDKIFKGRKIDRNFIFYFLIHRIREEFLRMAKNDPKEQFRSITLSGLSVVSFLNELQILDELKEEKMEERRFKEFFERFPELNNPLKKGLIMLGCATQTLLEVQEEKRGSKPFLKQLKSLKMDEKDFKELLTKVQAKLTEYDALPLAKDFLEEASYYLLLSEGKSKMSLSEMNFYFAVGMNLKWEILNSRKKEDKNE